MDEKTAAYLKRALEAGDPVAVLLDRASSRNVMMASTEPDSRS